MTLPRRVISRAPVLEGWLIQTPLTPTQITAARQMALSHGVTRSGQLAMSQIADGATATGRQRRPPPAASAPSADCAWLSQMGANYGITEAYPSRPANRSAQR